MGVLWVFRNEINKNKQESATSQHVTSFSPKTVWPQSWRCGLWNVRLGPLLLYNSHTHFSRYVRWRLVSQQRDDTLFLRVLLPAHSHRTVLGDGRANLGHWATIGEREGLQELACKRLHLHPCVWKLGWAASPMSLLTDKSSSLPPEPTSSWVTSGLHPTGRMHRDKSPQWHNSLGCGFI